ncbi:serine/threonine-protein kinase protein CCR3 [Spatholobus suberectus]|nr:serine/threonine-protein kinase protein CCR3 [Spatholobus suberectus]
MCPKRAVALHASAKAHTYFHFHLANQMDSEIIKSIDMTDITVDASVPDFLSRVEKHIESENSSMANSGSGTSNRVVPAPAGFTWAVDSAIRSSTAPNSLASQVRSFTSVVDKAMRSSSGADLGASSLHSFASEVESAMRSIEQDTGTSHSPASGRINKKDEAERACGEAEGAPLIDAATLFVFANGGVNLTVGGWTHYCEVGKVLGLGENAEKVRGLGEKVGTLLGF